MGRGSACPELGSRFTTEEAGREQWLGMRPERRAGQSAEPLSRAEVLTPHPEG